MKTRSGLFAALGFLVALLLGGAGLWVMSSSANLPGTRLRADLTIQDFRLPSSFRVDPQEISEQLSEALQQRAARDFAIRTLLGTDGQTKLSEVVVPRLLTTGVIRRLIQDMDSLGTVVSVAEYKGLITGTIHNLSGAPLDDVALILPGVTHAETATGDPLGIQEPDAGLQAITFGTLAPGSQVTFSAWFDDHPWADPAFEDRVRVGASGRLDGVVALRGQEAWMGSSLQTTPWARWIVLTVLAATATGGFLGLGYVLLARLRPTRKAAP